MDPTLDPVSRDHYRSVLAFARGLDVAPATTKRTFDRDAWDRCAAFGLLAQPIPKDHGGAGQSVLNTVYGFEAFGRGCPDNGLAFAMGAHLWACTMPLLMFGTDDQHRRLLGDLVSGQRIACHAASEPMAGSDVFSLRTRATRRGDGYVLDGTKCFVTNAPVADLALVFANVDPAWGMAGVSAFLVDPTQPGVQLTRSVSKMGMSGATMGELVFDGCVVPEADRLGAEGAGLAIFSAGMEWERAFIMAPAIGAMQRLIDRTIETTRTRRRLAPPDADAEEGPTHLIAEMERAVQTSRALLQRAAHRKDADKRIAAEAAMVKLHVSESWAFVASTAMRLHGASGTLTETGLEEHVRDSVGSKIYSGTSEIQRDVITRYLGL